MTESKTYQLAKRCRGAVNRTQPQLRSLGCYASQQENGQQGSSEVEELNIFNETGLAKEKRIDFNQDASYRYVGVKELRAYQARTDKKKRNLNSLNLRVSESAVSFSRASAVKAPQVAYLTKQEILKQISVSRTASTDKEQEIYLKEKSSFMTTGGFDSTMTSFKGKEGNKDSCGGGKPSLSKIKGLRRKYQNQWNVAIESRNIVKRQGVGHKKYRSVLENVEIFREKVEVRERHGLIERTSYIQACDWQLTLHNEKSLKTIHERQEVKISKEMKATGCQKYRKQLAWVQQKDEEGCFFKLITRKSNPNP